MKAVSFPDEAAPARLFPEAKLAHHLNFFGTCEATILKF